MHEGISPEGFLKVELAGLHRYAFALCGQAEQAEDLVAEALGRTLPHWAQLNTPAAYLRTTIAHVYLNERRSESTRDRHQWRFVETTDRTDTGDDTDTRLDIREALMSLSPQARAVLVLRYLEDRSVQDTAAVLDRPQGTIRRITHEALEKLRHVLPDPTQSPEVPEQP